MGNSGPLAGQIVVTINVIKTKVQFGERDLEFSFLGSGGGTEECVLV